MDNLNQKLGQYKVPIALSFVGLILIIAGSFSSGLLDFTLNQTKTSADFPIESIVKPQVTNLKVDVSGAVTSPGVYALSENERVEDAIKKAGGFTSSASSEFVSKNLNLSQKITDGQKIYIPFQGESLPSNASGQVSDLNTQGKISINNATLQELDSLSGIGPVTAQKIIQNRPYDKTSDLLDKKSVSKSIYEKIKDQIQL